LLEPEEMDRERDDAENRLSGAVRTLKAIAKDMRAANAKWPRKGK
jgi:hypothetical protein